MAFFILIIFMTIYCTFTDPILVMHKDFLFGSLFSNFIKNQKVKTNHLSLFNVMTSSSKIWTSAVRMAIKLDKHFKLHLVNQLCVSSYFIKSTKKNDYDYLSCSSWCNLIVTRLHLGDLNANLQLSTILFWIAICNIIVITFASFKFIVNLWH